MPVHENKERSHTSSRQSSRSANVSSRPHSMRSERPAYSSRGSSHLSAHSGKARVKRSGKGVRAQINTAAYSTHDDQHEHGIWESDASDSDETRTRATSDLMDFSVDIYAESGWDTDLEKEFEDEKDAFDVTGKAVYIEACKKNGVIPASYFLRHMQDKKLSLQHHGLGCHGIKPIAISLVSNTHVLKLDLRDNWLAEEGGLHMCGMLNENCYITDLDLSENRLGYLFAEKFVEVLSHNSTLTHITLAGNYFDDKAAVFLADGIMHTSRVEYLNLSHNQLGEAAGIALGPAISENTSIKHLDLSWNCIRRKGAVAIAKGIKTNILMQKINLSWNGLGNDGAKALGDALKANPVLEEMDISNNRITAEGAVQLGKGVALTETLQVLKMGKNPMQTAGCYAICAAILKNPNCIIARLDFSDVMVNSDFFDIYKKVKDILPSLNLRHGGDGLPKKPKARVHPMMKLKNYIEKHNLRLVDFFNRFDKDHSMSVTRDEFAQGIEESGIKLTEDEITLLLEELDKDGDGEINYSEMVMGHQDFTEKEKKMATSILSVKPSDDKIWKS